MQDLLQILVPSGVALITVIILWRTLHTHDNQLFVSNFNSITNDIGSKVTIACRALLYHSKDLIDELEKRPEIKTQKLTAHTIDENLQLVDDDIHSKEIRLRALLEVIKYIAATYNRVGMLMNKDKKLKKEVIDYHGFVIGKMWIMTEEVIKQQNNWENGYKYFKTSYNDSYDVHWQKLIRFKLDRKEKNTNNLP